jgi:hypothetical protein
MNLFYNIASVLIGILLIFFGVMTLMKKKKIAFSVLTFIHAAFFIGFGILGFTLMGTEYEVITILAMLAFTITFLIVMLTLYKKEPVKKDNDDPTMKK